ncbi:MAG: DoxX family membrane protein [Patescibacteria group bacterium]|nr:DoxX family membrane protein [Patescibacteria group bacterium]
MEERKRIVTQIPEPKITKILFANTRISALWLLIRLYVGWQWLIAGYEKIQNPVWVGPKAGVALHGFLTGALAKSSGPHPDVQGWYAVFIKDFVLPNSVFFSYLVSFGELLVGIALILGIFTGIAAFFGAYMNMNYLLAGTVSTNPILFLLELLLILAWRVAGWWGLDRYALPLLGTPWKPGKLFKRKK